MIPENSLLLCDKPAGITSHDLVASLRRELRAEGRGGGRRHGPRVGHAGTLDPFATGLLIVLTGSATRLQRYLMAQPKTYRATAKLGWRSTTGDPDGELTETGRIPARLELPTGKVKQRLPMTSAVRVDGERLYRKAHRGETVETPEREIEVYSAELLEHAGDRAEFEITCSAGTYIRTLIETLDDAYCAELRRTAIGHLRLVDGQRLPVTPAEALAFLPRRELTSEEREGVRQGRRVAAEPQQPPWAMYGKSQVPYIAGEGRADVDRPDRDRVALVAGEDLVAVARREGDELQPEVVLV